jgi:hypothetical protein
MRADVAPRGRTRTVENASYGRSLVKISSAVAKWLIRVPDRGHYLVSMITFLLELLSLFPFLVGGHRQLALETSPCTSSSPSRRLQANGAPAEAPHDGSSILGRTGPSQDRLEAGRPWSSSRPTPSYDGSADASASTGPSSRVGLPKTEIAALVVRKMAAANPLWGAPRIHGELLKLGIDVAKRTVSRLMPKRRPQPSQNWRTFLANQEFRRLLNL